MKPITTSLRQILVSLGLIYLSALMLASDSCTRQARARWPLDQGWTGLQSGAARWLSAADQTRLQQWQGSSTQVLRDLLPPHLGGNLFQCEK